MYFQFEREEIEVNGSKILLSLFEKYKNESWVLSGSELLKKKYSIWNSGKWSNVHFKLNHPKYGLKSGIFLSENSHTILYDDDSNESIKLSKLVFVSDRLVENHFSLDLSLKKMRDSFRFDGPNIIRFKYGFGLNESIKLSVSETKFFKEFIDEVNNEVDREMKLQEKKKDDYIKRKDDYKKKLKKLQNSLIEEFDKDDNGIIDVIEGDDDFMLLFKKHQKKIIELDKDYIKKFVKISNYLKTKRGNIQDVFSSIKNTDNEIRLDNTVGILKNQIHTYELLLFHSLNMITSIVEDDLIVFYEIYESFDKLNMFNSNWENEVSQKLSNIGEGLSELMSSINSMERNIVSGLTELSYVTQEGFKELGNSVTRELQSIDSSIKFNNLLTGIQTYQMYKINKNTKFLRG